LDIIKKLTIQLFLQEHYKLTEQWSSSRTAMVTNTTNNNQTFYSQASWGRLEMKPHESKKQVQNKSEKEGKKQRVIKKPNKKKEKRQ
jgi:hypothetical protein